MDPNDPAESGASARQLEPPGEWPPPPPSPNGPPPPSPTGQLPLSTPSTGELPTGWLPPGQRPSPAGPLPAGELQTGQLPAGELQTGQLPAGPRPSAAGSPSFAAPAWEAAPTAAYPMPPPAAPPYFPSGPAAEGGRGAERPRHTTPGLVVAGAVLALLLAGVVGFVMGVQVEKGRRTTAGVAAAPPASSTTSPSVSGAASRSRSVGGKIDSVSGGTMTVTLANGTTATVTLSGSTRFQKTSPGSPSDLAPGTVVIIQGPRGADGSIAANMVTIVPPGTRVPGAAGPQSGRATTTTAAPAGA